MSTTTMNIRIDKELKKETEAILSALGLTTSAAVTIFAKAIVRDGGIPFDLKLRPNAETMQVLDDVKRHRNMSRTFDNVDELMEDLNAPD